MAVTEPQSSEPVAVSAAVGKRKVSVRAIIALASVAVVVYGIDQLTKFLVVKNLTENQQVSVIGEILTFHFVRNPGAAFSFATGLTWIFSIAAVAVTVFIVLFARRIRSLGWAVLFGMLLGGTTGNLTDRLFRPPGFGVGEVVDFIQVYGFNAIFNIADSFICASMGLFIILTIRGVGLDGKRHITSAAAASVDEAPVDAAPVEATSTNVDNPSN